MTVGHFGTFNYSVTKDSVKVFKRCEEDDNQVSFPKYFGHYSLVAIQSRGEPDACLWLIQDSVVLILGDRTTLLEGGPVVET